MKKNLRLSWVFNPGRQRFAQLRPQNVQQSHSTSTWGQIRVTYSDSYHLTLAGTGGGGCKLPPWVFFLKRNSPRSPWRITPKFCIANGVSLAQLLAKKMTGSSQVKGIWRHTSNSLRPIFHRKRVFSNIARCHCLEWRHHAWFRSEYGHVWPLTLHLDLPEVIQDHRPWPTSYLPMVAKFFFFGGGKEVSAQNPKKARSQALRFWDQIRDLFLTKARF